MDWSPYFPRFIEPGPPLQSTVPSNANSEEEAEAVPRKLTSKVEILDIGCGFGGLLMALSPLHPNTLMLGKTSP
jgi:tRNA (guanine-N7-)-methyltransferase